MSPRLELPNTKYKESFLVALKEYHEEGRHKDFDYDYVAKNFNDFVLRLNGRAEGKYLPPGFVPETTYWLIDNGEYVGRTSIRPNLTEHLEKEGGHIGYDIQPSKRGKGYGKLILKLALKKANEMGLRDILITCDITNIPSKKVIEANAGILKDSVFLGKGRPEKLRYKIKLL